EVSNGKSADHPFISGVVVVEGVEGGGMMEYMEIKVRKLGMTVEVVLMEGEKVVIEVGVDEIEWWWSLGVSSRPLLPKVAKQKENELDGLACNN
ncbi:hypothetical protein Tco_1498441, partial [Tanacetum coccineum]